MKAFKLTIADTSSFRALLLVASPQSGRGGNNSWDIFADAVVLDLHGNVDYKRLVWNIPRAKVDESLDGPVVVAGAIAWAGSLFPEEVHGEWLEESPHTALAAALATLSVCGVSLQVAAKRAIADLIQLNTPEDDPTRLSISLCNVSFSAVDL